MSDSQKGIIDIPSFFLCPISLEIMKDPVTLSTGITYDRESIEKWLCNNKKGTCPVTKQPLTDVEHTPNHTLRRLIQSWCTINAPFGFERFPTPRLPVSKPQILKLLQDSKSPHMQMKSLTRLKTIVLESDMNKRSVEAAGAAEYLADVITNPSSTNMSSSSPAGKYPDEAGAAEYQADVITNPKSTNITSSSPSGKAGAAESLADVITNPCSTNLTSSSPAGRPSDEAVSILYHLHLSQTGLKSLFGRNGEFVEALTRTMQRTANDEVRAYAVLLLKSMMEVAEPVQVTSLKPDFFVELTRVLVNRISLKTTKAALKVLIGVCPWGRNRVKTVEAGAVPVLVDMLLDYSEKRVIETALMLLNQLCLCADGRAEFIKHGAGLAVVSKKIFRVSVVASEMAVRVLHSVAKYSGNASVVQEMLQLGVVGKLCFLLQVDYCGSKTSEKAREILKMHSRVWKNSSCIPYNLVCSYPS